MAVAAVVVICSRLFSAVIGLVVAVAAVNGERAVVEGGSLV